MKRSMLFFPTLMLTLFTGCISEIGQDPDFLGSAVIESRTRTIPAVVAGPLISVSIDEGQQVHSGDTVAIVDTIPFAFTLEELSSGTREITAMIAAKKSEIEAMNIDIEGLEREFSRIEKLTENGAATTQQRDNLSTKLKTAKARRKAARGSLDPLVEKIKTMAVKKEKAKDQLRRCFITAPSNGIVLTLYRTTGEVAGPGSPIAEIGQFDTMYADFFVPQPSLSTLDYGKKIRVRVDIDSSGILTRRFRNATVTWISEEAEFTPKNIQTRESRNELMFRIRCTIDNTDRLLKRGQPVEIWR